MRKRESMGWLCVSVLLALAANGCIMRGAWWSQEKAERTVELEHPLAADGTLAVETASGSIDVTGQEVDTVHVVATITARAATEEDAQALAEQVTIRFEEGPDRLEIKADRPPQENRQSISISYQIVTPWRTAVRCSSASGSLKLANLTGNLDAHTASGSVQAARIEGTVNLRSASGSVHGEDMRRGDIELGSASGSIRLLDAVEIGRCELYAASGSVTARNVEADSVKMRSASGSTTLVDGQAQTANLHSSSGRVTAENVDCADLKAESVSGSVRVAFSPAAPSEVTAEMRSGSGSIDVTVPPGFAGQVELSVGSGSIDMGLPVTVSGRVDKKHISGTIGTGNGRLSARTTSGSIRVR